jgi:hypothetical protein
MFYLLHTAFQVVQPIVVYCADLEEPENFHFEQMLPNCTKLHSIIRLKLIPLENSLKYKLHI